MKFSNFVSSLALVCLAFNADALNIQAENRYDHKSKLSDEKLKALFLKPSKMNPEYESKDVTATHAAIDDTYLNS